jgi:hypothetical protein
MRVQESRTKSLRDAASYAGGNAFPRYIGPDTSKSATASNNTAEVTRQNNTPTPRSPGGSRNVGVTAFRQAIKIQKMRRSPRVNFSPKAGSEMTVMDVMTTPKALSFFLGKSSSHSKSSTPVHAHRLSSAGVTWPRRMSLQDSSLLPILRKAPSTPTAGARELADARPRRRSLQDIRVRINIGRAQSTPTASSAFMHRLEAKLETHAEINEETDSCAPGPHNIMARSRSVSMQGSAAQGDAMQASPDAAARPAHIQVRAETSSSDLGRSRVCNDITVSQGGDKENQSTNKIVPVHHSSAPMLSPTASTHTQKTARSAETDMTNHDIQSEAASELDSSVDDYVLTHDGLGSEETNRPRRAWQHHDSSSGTARHGASDSARSGGNRAPVNDEILTRAIAQAFRNQYPRRGRRADASTLPRAYSEGVGRTNSSASVNLRGTSDPLLPAAIASAFKGRRGRSEGRSPVRGTTQTTKTQSLDEEKSQARTSGSYSLFGRAMQSPDKVRRKRMDSDHLFDVPDSVISGPGKPISRPGNEPLQNLRAEGSLVYAHATVPQAVLQMRAAKRRASLEDICLGHLSVESAQSHMHRDSPADAANAHAHPAHIAEQHHNVRRRMSLPQLTARRHVDIGRCVSVQEDAAGAKMPFGSANHGDSESSIPQQNGGHHDLSHNAAAMFARSQVRQQRRESVNILRAQAALNVVSLSQTPTNADSRLAVHTPTL